MKKIYTFVFLLILGIISWFLNWFYQSLWTIGILICFCLIILWIYLLVGWGDLLVDWSVSIAKKFKISPLVIWLTVVSFGTSAPEFFINVLASLKWHTELLLSNIIWSNLANLLLILWISAVISKKTLKIKDNTLFNEIPFSFLATVVLFFMVNDKIIDWDKFNVLSRIDWLLLLSFFVIFMYYVYSLIKSDKGSININGANLDFLTASIFIFLGILWLYFGWELVVKNAAFFAQKLGVSMFLVWATIVAIWTSLPELVASVVSALKGHTDMAVWNVIGSNIFNIFWIWWISSILHPVPFQTKYNIDIIFLIIVTLSMFLAVFFSKSKNIWKLMWFVYVLLYIWYICFVIWRW